MRKKKVLCCLAQSSVSQLDSDSMLSVSVGNRQSDDSRTIIVVGVACNLVVGRRDLDRADVCGRVVPEDQCVLGAHDVRQVAEFVPL